MFRGMAAIRYPNTSRPKLYSSVGIDRAREGWTIVFVGSQNVPLAKQELSYRQEKRQVPQTPASRTPIRACMTRTMETCAHQYSSIGVGLLVKLAVVISSDHRRKHGWKVGGDLMWGGCRSPFFFSSVPPPSSVVAPPMFCPFPFLLFFPSPLKFSQEVCGSTVSFPLCPANNDSQLHKLEGTKYTRSPWSPKLEGGASHHIRVVGPMHATDFSVQTTKVVSKNRPDPNRPGLVEMRQSN